MSATAVTSPFRACARALALTCLALLGLAARGQTLTYSLTGTTIPAYPAGGPGYLIDSDRTADDPDFSDPLYSRWYIEASADAAITRSSSGSSSVDIRVGFRLIDTSTSAFVPLEGDNASGWVYSTTVTRTVSWPFVNNSTHTRAMIPTVRLDPMKTYRIESVLQTVAGRTITDVDSQALATTYRYIHFQDSYASDPEANVVAVLESGLTYSRTWAVNTDAAHPTFRVSAPYTIYRHDDPLEGPNDPANVTVRFTVELFSSAAPTTPIPLQDSTIDLAVNIERRGIGAPPAPAVVSGTTTLNFRPADGVQLDSVANTHYVKVTISHLESPEPGGAGAAVWETGNTRTMAYTRLLHFNGKLLFGSGALLVPTTFTSVTNNPSTGATVIGSPATRIDTALGVAAGAGSIDASPAFTYGGGTYNISLLPNGDAVPQSLTTIAVTPPTSPDRGSLNGLRYERGPITLRPTGATTSSLVLFLPAGMGIGTTSLAKTHAGRVQFAGGYQLTPLMLPTANPVWLPTAPDEAWVHEETKPVVARANSITWNMAAGRINIAGTSSTAVAFVRAAEYTTIEASPVSATAKVKRSNDLYWRWVATTSTGPGVDAGYQGGAEYTGGFTLSNATSLLYRTHFPYDASMRVSAATIIVQDDLIRSDFSTMTLATNVTMPWDTGCVEPSCDPSAATQVLQAFTADAATLRFTPDGGLVGTGVFPSTLDLRWGFIPSITKYAHRVVTPFTTGTLHIAGNFLRGDLNTQSDALGASFMLLSGANAASGALTERPKTNAYQNGFANYAGLNVLLGPNDAADSGADGLSTLTGQQYGAYALKNRCKYYVRGGGVSGIHDKVFGTPETVWLYGYEFTLTNFGLSFLTNANIDSRTQGNVKVPYPSDILQGFEEMKFFCNGGLDKAKIAPGESEKLLSYWAAPLDVLAMEFLQPDSCAVDEGYLTLGVNSYSSHIKETLSGRLGFLQNGNLLPKEFSDAKGGGLLGLDSRLRMPTVTRFRGPQRRTTEGGFEEYVFTPQVDAYFNIPGNAPNFTPSGLTPVNSAGAGFLNMAGRLKVAFFEALKAHVQTDPNRPPADPNNPGVWGSSPIFVANGTWDTGPSTTTFFDSSAYHDKWNRGFPYPGGAGGTGENLETYQSSPAFMTYARQSWLGGGLELKYKVKWSASTRSFASLDATQSADAADAGNVTKILVLEVDHRLPYLSAERAELTFGAEYAGMPKINLANFVVNQLDEVTGVFQAAVNAGCDVVFDELNAGIDEMAKLLNDQLTAHFHKLLDGPVDALIVDPLYLALKADWQNGGSWNPGGALTNYFGSSPTAFLQQKVFNKYLSDPSPAEVFNQVQTILGSVDKARNALHVINDQFLAQNPDGSIPIANNLARELIKMIAKEIGGALGNLVGEAGANVKLDSLLGPLFKEAEPTILDLKSAINALDDVLAQVQTTLGPAKDFTTELNAIFNSAFAELNTLSQDVFNELQPYLNTFGPGKNFLGVSEAQVKTRIRQAIYDRFFGGAIVGKIQVAMKQRLQDVEVAIRQGLDSIFGELNRMMRSTVSSLLSEVDDTINDTLGEFGKYLGAGSITGYATFNGDALRKLRLDARFQFKCPDEINVHAFLEINQYTSKDKPPGCYQPGGDETLTEVILGATDIPFDFLTPGVRINIDVKFSFTSDGQPWGIHPVGFGGSFAMASGTVNFEAFKITKFAVAVAFGRDDNYLSCAMGMEIKSWGAWGGVFFGRTCSIDPIKMWDPFAAKALGNPDPSFSGIYVYGEAHIPLSEAIFGIPATCLFQVTADAGLGFFYFVEGPTYGARFGLGLGGDLLCILSFNGRIDMVGGKKGGKTILTGGGEVCGSILGIEGCEDLTIGAEVEEDGTMTGSESTD